MKKSFQSEYATEIRSGLVSPIEKLPQLPPIDLKSAMKRSVDSQNIIQLSKMGIEKDKFINFKLKIASEIPSKQTQKIIDIKSHQRDIQIPLLTVKNKLPNPYPKTSFSLSKLDVHPLLVSRKRQKQPLSPGIGIYDTNALESIKYRKSQCALVLKKGRQSIVNFR